MRIHLDSMPSGWRLRRASADDAAMLSALGRETFLQSHGHSASPEDIEAYTSAAFSLAALQKELGDPAMHFFILSIAGQALGYSKLVMDSTVTSVGTEALCKLERVYVLSSEHGKGLGPLLMQHAIEYAQACQQVGMWLYVWVENHRAIAFYRKLGFKTIGAYDFKISEGHSNPNHQLYLAFDQGTNT